MACVSLVRHQGNVKSSLSQALDSIGGLGRYINPNDRVLLKPNLNDVAVFTNISFTESLIQMLLDLRARPFIAESTFGNANMTNAFFRQTGYSDLAAKYGIDIFNLNQSQSAAVQVPDPLVTESVQIAKEVFEADKIINLPTMKVHYATGITICLKNLKGLLVGDEKRRFHEIGLEEAIVDLNNSIHAHLNIVDALTCMERMGPRGGDPFDLNLILAGENAAEVDYIGMSIMDYTLDEVQYLKRYLEINNLDTGRIHILGERFDRVKRPFKKVNLAGIIPNGFVIHEHGACSSCMNAFLLSCQIVDSPQSKTYQVFIGTHRPESHGTDQAIAFGNCCPIKDTDIVVKGCPPYPFALKEKIAASEDKAKAGL
jgi:uncharacterized protein (DUF362 family)